MIDGIENMEKGIESFIGVSKQFKHALQVAETVPVNREETSKFSLRLDHEGRRSRWYPRTRNTVERLSNLFVTEFAGNRGETLPRRLLSRD